MNCFKKKEVVFSLKHSSMCGQGAEGATNPVVWRTLKEEFKEEFQIEMFSSP